MPSAQCLVRAAMAANRAVDQRAATRRGKSREREEIPSLTSFPFCQPTSCKLDQKPKGAKETGLSSRDQPSGAESKPEKSIQGQKLTEGIGKRGHWHYLNLPLSLPPALTHQWG